MSNTIATFDIVPITVPTIKFQPKHKRYYFDVALGSILLSGEDTGGAYCLLDLRVAPGKGVPRHTHTREDEAIFVVSGELEAIVGDEVFSLRIAVEAMVSSLSIASGRLSFFRFRFVLLLFMFSSILLRSACGRFHPVFFPFFVFCAAERSDVKIVILVESGYFTTS